MKMLSYVKLLSTAGVLLRQQGLLTLKSQPFFLRNSQHIGYLIFL